MITMGSYHQELSIFQRAERPLIMITVNVNIGLISSKIINFSKSIEATYYDHNKCYHQELSIFQRAFGIIRYSDPSCRPYSYCYQLLTVIRYDFALGDHIKPNQLVAIFEQC